MPARRLLRHARSDVVWALAGFAALQAGLAVAIARWLPELRHPAFGYKAKRLLARTAAPEPPFTVVMVGSSRTAYGLNGQRLEERYAVGLNRPLVVFNLGIPAGGAVTELLTLRRLLAAGVRPDHLLVEVMPVFLAGQAGAPREVDLLPPTCLHGDELGLAERFGVAGGPARRAWWQAALVPAYGLRFNILSRVLPRWLPLHLRQNWAGATDVSGWRPYFTNAAGRHDRARSIEIMREKFSPYLAGFRLGGPTCAALRELLGLCRAEGIPASLVLMPEGTDFRSWYTPRAWGQIQAFLDGLRAEFGVAVVNAREWVADDGFSDSHHLLEAGSTAFTDRLGDEVIRRLLPGAGHPSPTARAHAARDP